MIVSQQRYNLILYRLNVYLCNKVKGTVKTVLNNVIENGIGEGLRKKVQAKISVSKSLIVRSMRTSFAGVFENDQEAFNYVTQYFNQNWTLEIQQYFKNNSDYFTTPGGSIAFIPNGEITYYNNDGAVYAFKFNGVEYFWDFREDIYYDIHSNVYNPHGELAVGNRTPRYIKEAYKKLLQIRVKYPRAKLYPQQRDGYKEAVIAINHNDYETTIFGGPNMNFDTKKYPNVNTGVGLIPVIGSGIQAYYDFEDGDWEWGLANTGLAISDAFLVRSIVKGVARGGVKAISKASKLPWSERPWMPSMRKFYGESGFVLKNQHLHHWIIPRNQWGKNIPPFIKNQMWNLHPIPKINGMSYGQVHNAIEGKGPYGWSIFKRMYYGTPSWPYTFFGSYGGRIIESNYND